MPVLIKNNAKGQLSVAADAAATTLSLMSGEGERFPALSAGQWFPVTLIKDDGVMEVCRCTARSGDTLTVTRAQEGTAGAAFNAGDRVELRLTTGALNELTLRQTSATDTTANALMPVGAFGLGGLLAMSDANWPIPGGGFYQHDFTETSTSETGYPRLGNDYPRHWNTIALGPESRKTEIASEVYGQSSSRGRTFIRVKHDTDWYPWREVYTQGSILGTVSQSSGVPTGAIIERGSNANGQYVKYADGTLICWHKTDGGGTNWFDWTYPASFSTVPVLHAAINPGGNSTNVFATQAFADLTLASIRKKYMPNTGSSWYDATGETVDLLAIGRWF